MTPFTIEDMHRFAGETWGPLGIKVVERWCEYKVTYFDGALQPVPRALTGLTVSQRYKRYQIVGTRHSYDTDAV